MSSLFYQNLSKFGENFAFLNPGVHILNIQENPPAILDVGQLPGPEHFPDCADTSPQIYRRLLDGIQPFGYTAHRIAYPLRLCKPLFLQSLFSLCARIVPMWGLRIQYPPSRTFLIPFHPFRSGFHFESMIVIKSFLPLRLSMEISFAPSSLLRARRTVCRLWFIREARS